MHRPLDPLARRRRDLTALLLALAAVMLWDATPFDLWLAQRYGDVHGFAWNHHWLTHGVLHEGGKWASRLLVGALALSIRWPVGPARWLRPEARVWWLVVTLFSMALIAAFKRASLTSCPAELSLFGGHALHVSHWAWGVADGGPGHCFPSGHASTAFGFVAGYFALRHVDGGGPWRAGPSHWGASRWWLIGTCAVGLLFGWAQMMRGSHYLSHALWTAWICAAASLPAAWVAEQRGWFARDTAPAWPAGAGRARPTPFAGAGAAHSSNSEA
jgi:membrane-associated PAP2 superfamily phosphatase